MIKRLVKWFVLLPLSAVLVFFALANRNVVELNFDPFAAFSGQVPLVPSLNLPLFLVIYGALILGVILGGIATWFSQGRQRTEKRRWRKRAKKLEMDNIEVTRQSEIEALRDKENISMLDAP